MAYNTISDFKTFAYPSGSFVDVPDSLIAFHLSGARSEIDSALRTHHTLPMNTGSYKADLMVLYHAEITIASYRLMMYEGFKPSIDGTSDAVLQNRYIDVVGENGLLERIQKGKMLFPDSADATPNTSEGRFRVYGKSGRSIRLTKSDGSEVV